MKIKHTRAEDFIEVESEIPDHQVALAKTIINVVDSPSPVVISDDGSKLMILSVSQLGEKYRITIEQV